jgi:Holliday junction DNA helicase RuvA
VITWLSGTLLGVSGQEATVDVGGVGYGVVVSSRSLGGAGEGDKVVLWCHTHVREDAITVYGFADQEDRDAFRRLLGIQGVGVKLASAVIGTLGAKGLGDAISFRDVDALCAVPGVGPKSARGIIAKLAAEDPEVPSVLTSTQEEVVGVLVSLGYQKADALAALRHAGAVGDSEEAVRAAVAWLAGQGK